MDEVIEQLEKVRRLAPKEPPVYTMLGRAYQRLGRNDEALKYYNFAIDLDPKEAAGLKVNTLLRYANFISFVTRLKTSQVIEAFYLNYVFVGCIASDFNFYRTN